MRMWGMNLRELMEEYGEKAWLSVERAQRALGVNEVRKVLGRWCMNCAAEVVSGCALRSVRRGTRRTWALKGASTANYVGRAQRRHVGEGSCLGCGSGARRHVGAACRATCTASDR